MRMEWMMRMIWMNVKVGMMWKFVVVQERLALRCAERLAFPGVAANAHSGCASDLKSEAEPQGNFGDSPERHSPSAHRTAEPAGEV